MSSYSPLNPGVPARKRNSFCKFCLCLGLTLFGLALATIIFFLGKTLFEITQFSHSHVFQNQTLEEVKNRTTVVRPLVDEKQSFDIAVSVWSLPVEEHDGERNGSVSETALYSDIVFRGLRLADQHKLANLTYKLPVAVFRRLLLKEHDLRASFVLIPTSPSLMDQVVNFSTWRPEILQIPPVRSWPFPLGASDNGPQSIADRAMDSFGISMPLLEFHEVHSRCATASNPETSSSAEEPPEKDDDEDYDDEETQDWVKENHSAEESPSGVSNITGNPEHALKRHPFIVTRTQIRVVDEVHIFNRKEYNREHKKLRATSCGQGRNKQPDLNLCYRTYETNGNWETRLDLQITDEETGELHTEWAYAPYMGHNPASAGPKDVVAVPVTRENCTQFENTSSTDPDFIHVHWQLSYSGRSPAKFVSTQYLEPSRVKHNESDYKKALAHNSAEITNGLFGHRFYEDAHPRRRMIISLLISVLSLAWSILEMSYWYTRTSTVSISVSGTTFLALGKILSGLTVGASSVETQKLEFSTSNWLPWLWLIIMTLATKFTLPFFMIKTVTRLAFSRDKSRWIPSVRRISATHMERASQRLDSRTSWGIKASVCVSLVAINYYFPSLFNYFVLGSRLPNPGPKDVITNVVARVYARVNYPLKITGVLSQLLLNQRSKTFAGSYKITVVVSCMNTVLNLALFIPSIVGRYDARPGLSVLNIADWIMLTILAWQAVVFPKVTEKMEDEDSE